MITGIGVSSGIAFGKVLVIDDNPLIIEKRENSNTLEEKQKLLKAIDTSKAQLLAIKEKALKEFGAKNAKIFDAHVMMIQDPELINSAVKKIEAGKLNAEYAFKRTADEYIAVFEAMNNEYMRERAADIKDVSQRVLKNLLGVQITDLAMLNEEVILVSTDLSPSDTAAMNKEKVIGFLTNIGGRTSHTAIMARTLEIPAVVGLNNITENLKSGDYVVFDGETGDVQINPSEEIINHYKMLKHAYLQEKKALEEIKGKKSITIDGRKVELAGNIGTLQDISSLINNDAESVGLFRTEFIYMNRESLPTEEEQFEIYRKALEMLNSKPVVIRTLDIGGDKKLPYLKIDEEMNPFLGYRAIRFCLREQDIFKTQLRALLRASVYGNLKIMFPMISSMEELLEAKSVYNKAKSELDNEGIAYAANIQVGMMIEIPSAAIASDILARHVDFFSIGTNDLIQYTCAVDRMNEKVQHLYQPFNPGVLRLIKMVIDNGHKQGIWVGMCGEMAGDKRMIPILLGMGLDEFSMSTSSILPARKLIQSLAYEKAQDIANQVLNLSTVNEIENFLAKNF